MKCTYTIAISTNKTQAHSVDIPLEEWMQIFMAFLTEHVRAFPKDAPSMQGYVDLIIKMVSGMLWLQYNMLLQKRANKIDMGSRKIKNWAVTDIVLYLACQPPRSATRFSGSNPTSHRPSLGLSAGPTTTAATTNIVTTTFTGGILMQSRTCPHFQSARGCDGLCLWPHTHQCYSCARITILRGAPQRVPTLTGHPRNNSNSSLFLLMMEKSSKGQLGHWTETINQPQCCNRGGENDHALEGVVRLRAQNRVPPSLVECLSWFGRGEQNSHLNTELINEDW